MIMGDVRAARTDPPLPNQGVVQVVLERVHLLSPESPECLPHPLPRPFYPQS